MTVYIYSISLSLMLIWLTNKFIFKKNATFYWFFSIISLLPTTIIAGVRNLTVGTDIRHYIAPNFTAALNFNNLFEYVQFVTNTKSAYVDTVNHTEMGYSVIVYLVSRLTDNPMWLLFTLQAISVLAVYYSIYLLRLEYPKISITFGMLVYYTLFYGPSLNIMRQTVAASLVLLATMLLVRRHPIVAVVVFFIAIQLHISSLIGIVIFLIYLIRTHKFKRSLKLTIPYFWYILLCYIVVLEIGPIIFKGIQVFTMYIPILQKYSASFGSIGGLSNRQTLLMVVSDLVIFAIIGLVDVIQKDKIIDSEDWISIFFFQITVITTLFYGMYSFQTVIPRLGLFFAVFRVVSYSYYFSKINKAIVRIFCYILMIIVLFFVFFRITLSGSGEIFPYTSDILTNWISNII